MDEKYIAVRLDGDKCTGCINCMKRCPTEAIRVRNGKANINHDRCIGCGECIRVCKHRAKYASYDNLDIIKNFKYKVVLPPPSLYGQFRGICDPAQILNGLIDIGFDDVFEVARGADMISGLTKQALKKNLLPKPCISTACPVCVQLILMRFHSLSGNLLKFLPPVDICAKLAREDAAKKTGLKDEEIGVFFISPCPAKVSAIKNRFSSDITRIDGVFSVKDVCVRLMLQGRAKSDRLSVVSSNLGIAWAQSGGEAKSSGAMHVLACDGIENVMSVLHEIEDGKLTDEDFIELNACPGGCVGGVLNAENPFVAKSKIKRTRKEVVTGNQNTLDKTDKEKDFYKYDKEWELVDPFKLDHDFAKAMEKMKQIENIMNILPKIDCGLCGAPSCAAFAEDVAQGVVDIELCERRKI